MSILPDDVARRLKAQPTTRIAEHFDDVTILFVDWVGFTDMASARDPTEVVDLLDRVFMVFDEICEKHGVEKVKTIGDAYMAVAGVPTRTDDHVHRIAREAFDIIENVPQLMHELGVLINFRVGIATGPVVAGIIGDKRFSYDLWGDTVNTASRMESQGVPGKVQVTEATRNALGDRFELVERGLIDVKGKGELLTYFLVDSAAE